MKSWVTDKIVEVFFYTGHFEYMRKQYNGKCPFHDEFTPSFLVNPHKLEYICTKCGEEGEFDEDTYRMVDKMAKEDRETALKRTDT